MANANMHYLYNTDYFNGIKEVHDPQKPKVKYSVDGLKEKNKVILSYNYQDNTYLDELVSSLKEAYGDVVVMFDLKTVYPGLMSGIGYAHSVSMEDGIKGGFYLDYVTGLPIIPGSGIKGVLRSYFPEKSKKDNEERKKLIKELIGRDYDEEKLLEQLFASNDVFLGAYPVIEHGKQKKDGIFGIDYITKHEDPVKDPNPVSFLKVKPGICYRFLFILGNDEEGLSIAQKTALYKQLLLIGGAGAKTNVGFGQFE